MRHLDVTYLEKPYEGENGSISMFIFLPVFTPIDRFLAKLTSEMLDEVFEKETAKRWAELELPKISFGREFDLMPVNNKYILGTQREIKNQMNLFFAGFETYWCWSRI